MRSATAVRCRMAEMFATCIDYGHFLPNKLFKGVVPGSAPTQRFSVIVMRKRALHRITEKND